MRYYFVSGMYYKEQSSWGIICCCLPMEKFSVQLIIKKLENALKDRGVKSFGKVTIISITRLTQEEFNEAK